MTEPNDILDEVQCQALADVALGQLSRCFVDWIADTIKRPNQVCEQLAQIVLAVAESEPEDSSLAENTASLKTQIRLAPSRCPGLTPLIVGPLELADVLERIDWIPTCRRALDKAVQQQP